MFKTLAILAVSMTGTTIVLSHLEPGASRALPYPFPDRIRQAVVAAVASADQIAGNTWSCVEILKEREVAGFRKQALAAVPDAGQYHFWIGDTGAVVPAPSWRGQESTGGAGTIRIALSDRGSSSGVSPLQWAALQMLLLELSSAVDTELSGQVRLVLSDVAAADTFLCARLQHAGLLG